jgi:competence ComEA-like helix-hairpin-helix protein
LESLAAKHGAKPEELVTDPNARKETAPEWVQKSAEASSPTPPPAEAAAPPEEPFESVPEWIEPAKEETGSIFAELEDTQPQEPLPPAAMDETGIWLRDLSEEAGTVSEQEPVAEAEAPALSTEEDVPEWLREMETEPSKAEAGPPSEEGAQVPEWLSEMEAEPSKAEEGSSAEQKDEEVPDWLSEMKAEASTPEAGPVSAGEPQEIPDWLLGVETDPTATERLPVFPAEEETTFEPGQGAAGKIDINSATVEQLAELPGVGEFLAQNIVAYREIYGAYASIDDLSNIVGIDQAMIDDLRSQVEVHPGEPEITDWLQSLEAEETGAKAEETVAEETASDDFPSWLAGLDEKPVKPEAVVGAEDDLPEWLRTVDEQEPVQSQPTAPTDWQPVDLPTAAFPEEPPVPAGAPETLAEEPPAQAAPSAPTTPEPEPQPVEPKREPYVEPVTRSRPGMTGMLSAAQDPALTQAQVELTRGNISGALQNYEKLIRRGKMLDEIIFDLREALYRYPVDVSILQALGDAYMRSNRLQDALDSYTKAEELLR